MEKQTLPPHKIYTVCDIKEADAVAWALLDPKGDLVKYPFKFPAIKDEEVRIKITYTSMCQSDVHMGRKLWFEDIVYPIVPGHEVIGRITMVGKDVKDHKVGDLVGCCPQRSYCNKCEYCAKEQTNLCTDQQGLYNPYFGGYATHIQLPGSMAFPIPKDLPEDMIAPLLCAGVTTFAPIQRNAKKGLKCGIIGIGGLGHLALQFAKHFGMEVTAFTTSGNDRSEELKKFGADHISHSTDLNILKQEEGKYDLICNTIFKEAPQQYIAYQALVKKGGVFVQIGAPNTKSNLPLDFMSLVLGQKRLEGSIIGSHKEVCQVLDFSAKHKIIPTIEKVDFEDFPKAFQKLEHGRPHFRQVVDVTTWAKKNGFDK